jgi:hypothetical protein
MSKKTLITAVSTAAMVATLGFAYAQSTDEEAYNHANINGSVNNTVPKHWARDSVIDNNPYDTAAPTAAGPSSTMPADTTAMPADTTTSSSTATTPAADATSPWAADTTSTTSTTSTTTTSSGRADTSTSTPAANTTDSVNQTNGSLSTNTAPSETHYDLNSPDDPIYNMGKNNSERAPRPDRN